jgi:HD-GYP domain-containing protein (c-di-GMP phosphodiesterase class II)
MKTNEDSVSIQNLQRRLIELTIASEAIIDSFVHALDLREREAEGHTARVAELTVRLAKTFNLMEAQLNDIKRGALLHDIGKMGIPDYVLQKPSALDDEEWALVRKHPQIAYDLLSPVAYLHGALDIPYYHHEKWNGTGYPQGLSGEQIPLGARIFAIVDVWDALTSDRPYRNAWTKPEALEHIHSQSGVHFDPLVVERFLELQKQENQE